MKNKNRNWKCCKLVRQQGEGASYPLNREQDNQYLTFAINDCSMPYFLFVCLFVCALRKVTLDAASVGLHVTPVTPLLLLGWSSIAQNHCKKGFWKFVMSMCLSIYRHAILCILTPENLTADTFRCTICCRWWSASPLRFQVKSSFRHTFVLLIMWSLKHTDIRARQ